MSPRRLVVLATCMLTAVACAPAEQDSAEAAVSQDESVAAYQEQLVEGWPEAFNAGDAQRIAALYTEDAVRLPPDAAPIQGREAIRRNFQETFDGFTSLQIWSSPPEEIHVSGDWVMERGTWTLEGTPANGAVGLDQGGNYVVVSRRGADGQWKVHWEMWSIH